MPPKRKVSAVHEEYDDEPAGSQAAASQAAASQAPPQVLTSETADAIANKLCRYGQR